MRILAILSVLVHACFVFIYGKRCNQKDLCSCEFDDGSGIVDITSLGNTDDTPRFKDVSSADGNFYSFNPCYGFTENECNNASVCIQNSAKTTSVQIGDASKAGYQYNQAAQSLVVAYTSGSLASLKLTEIILVCDPNACSPSIVANGQQAGGEFQMTLTSVCACANGCSTTGPNNCSSGAENLNIWHFLLVICAFLTIVAK